MKKQIKLFNNYGVWEEGNVILKESEDLVIIFDYEIPEKTSLYETGVKYSEVVDVPNRYTYTESNEDIEIEKTEEFEDNLNNLS